MCIRSRFIVVIAIVFICCVLCHMRLTVPSAVSLCNHIAGSEMTMGRHSVCSFRFDKDERLISGRHCRIYRDLKHDSHGQGVVAFLQDLRCACKTLFALFVCLICALRIHKFPCQHSSLLLTLFSHSLSLSLTFSHSPSLSISHFLMQHKWHLSQQREGWAAQQLTPAKQRGDHAHACERRQGSDRYTHTRAHTPPTHSYTHTLLLRSFCLAQVTHTRTHAHAHIHIRTHARTHTPSSFCLAQATFSKIWLERK